MSNEYVSEVIERLQDNPTAQDLDYFIEAYTRIGYLVGVARGRAELAEATAKYERASAYANARSSGAAKSATDAEQIAIVESFEHEQKAIRAREASTKLSNLLSAIEQNINAIKYLGRATDAPMTLPRR